jgi:hypothetical protein
MKRRGCKRERVEQRKKGRRKEIVIIQNLEAYEALSMGNMLCRGHQFKSKKT